MLAKLCDVAARLEATSFSDVALLPVVEEFISLGSVWAQANLRAVFEWVKDDHAAPGEIRKELLDAALLSSGLLLESPLFSKEEHLEALGMALGHAQDLRELLLS